MASIKLNLSSRTDGEGRAEVLMRVSCGRGKQFRIHSGIWVPPERWDAAGERLRRPRGDREEAARLAALQGAMDAAVARVLRLLSGGNETPDKETLEEAATGRARADASGDGTFGDAVERLLASRRLSAATAANYRWLANAVARFAAVMRRERRAVSVSVRAIDRRWVERFRDFFASEGTYVARYPELYESLLKGKRVTRRIGDKSCSTVDANLNLLGTVLRWCVERGEIAENPCAKVERREVTYGTPFFLTPEERDRLADADLSEQPEHVRTARDVFVFQCFIGCRHSDLVRLRESSVVEGRIEYVPRKTRGHSGATVRVPLHPRAAAILERYAGWRRAKGRGRLLPSWPNNAYNRNIRAALLAAGITRTVTVLDPLSREEVQRPIWEVAGSHMARRTFCGNLYKKVRDPNLVGALSGHAEGSRAFVRYRDIDDEMRRDLIDLL